ncbi:YbaN family protein [Vibrio viridaestus]|nr:YbaN family protein [Vibrio viridaestus]
MFQLLRVLLILTGMLSIALGILGIFLPLLPTTPFLLLASACFVKSSPRFHHWLISHPTFGPIIDNWQQNRSVSSKVKRRGAIVMLISFCWSIWVVPIFWVKIALFIGMLIGLTFFLRLKVND